MTKIPAIGMRLHGGIAPRPSIELAAAADRVYCMQKGRVTLQGRAGALSRDEIKSAYFGI